MSDTVTRPNVVLVHCHDLGRQLGCYGARIDTPNIDRLATEGMRFDEHYCTAAKCSPSRASIMTGRYPHSNGMMGLAHVGWSLNDDERTLPTYLSAGGYSTHLFGLQHEAASPAELGYETAETESTRALDVAERFAERLGELGESEGPFFASVGFHEPHRPFRREYVPSEAYEYYRPATTDVPPYLPDRRGVREDIAALNALITATVDPALGRVMDALDGAGLAEDTLLLFTTDHGIALPRAKQTCYDPGLETALLARHPGRVAAGNTRSELLSNVDLLPTILEYLGLPVPDRVQGWSFRRLLDGQGEYDERERVYTELTWHGLYMPMRAVRTKRHKYVRNFSMFPSVVIPSDIFDTPAGKAVREEFYTRTCPEEEFYDLEADPHERENLASGKTIRDPIDRADWEPADADRADELVALRGDLHDWMIETADPLLDGPIPNAAETPIHEFVARDT